MPRATSASWLHRVVWVTSPRWTVLALAGTLLLTACATDVVVTAERADQLSGNVETAPPPTASDPQTSETPEATEATDPPDTQATVPSPNLVEGDPTAIDVGANKPPRAYDEFLVATVTDLEVWWTEQYPAVYGEAFRPLQGSVIAAYPERRGRLPGCGAPRTTYKEVVEFVAFYCGEGDFIIYDDGPNGLLAHLADEFGPATIGIVLAHEYGHAIQLRNNALDRRLPTITTEQQADCFAGAWAARAARGESTLVAFDDNDVRSGLIAMLEVRDPVGFDQTDPGGHGSGFDRVNAFQVGFTEGPARCAELIDAPLLLTPNEFVDAQDQRSGGNAPLDFTDNGLLTFLPDDLNLFWAEELDAEVPGFDGLTLELNDSISEVECDDLSGRFDDGGALCPSTGVVHLNGPLARELHSNALTFGDFSVGYLLATGWSEAVQRALGSDLEGEARHLQNDCLTGAWVKSVIPIAPFELPLPRHEDRTSSVSPGDLDEAIRTQIRLGDAGTDDNVIGTPFEKIEAFRSGVLGGLSACGI